jgi:hypothetical protein
MSVGWFSVWGMAVLGGVPEGCHPVAGAIDAVSVALDGTTDVSLNHHTPIHHGDWAVRMAVDGRPEFLPPTWVDPERKPLRNHLHRLE